MSSDDEPNPLLAPLTMATTPSRISNTPATVEVARADGFETSDSQHCHSLLACLIQSALKARDDKSNKDGLCIVKQPIHPFCWFLVHYRDCPEYGQVVAPADSTATTGKFNLPLSLVNIMVLNLCQLHPQLALGSFPTTKSHKKKKQIFTTPFEFLLENQASFEELAFLCTRNPQVLQQLDTTPSRKSRFGSGGYPLHHVCTANDCPDGLVEFMAQQFPAACSHVNQMGFLPAHLLLQNRHDRPPRYDGLETLVTLYPEALTIKSPSSGRTVLDDSFGPGFGGEFFGDLLATVWFRFARNTRTTRLEIKPERGARIEGFPIHALTGSRTLEKLTELEFRHPSWTMDAWKAFVRHVSSSQQIQWTALVLEAPYFEQRSKQERMHVHLMQLLRHIAKTMPSLATFKLTLPTRHDAKAAHEVMECIATSFLTEISTTTTSSSSDNNSSCPLTELALYGGFPNDPSVIFKALATNNNLKRLHLPSLVHLEEDKTIACHDGDNASDDRGDDESDNSGATFDTPSPTTAGDPVSLLSAILENGNNVTLEHATMTLDLPNNNDNKENDTTASHHHQHQQRWKNEYAKIQHYVTLNRCGRVRMRQLHTGNCSSQSTTCTGEDWIPILEQVMVTGENDCTTSSFSLVYGLLRESPGLWVQQATAAVRM